MNLFERIRMRREELGISQTELAHRLGYQSRSSINKIEQGINDIPQSKIIDFAKALNCSPAYLMGWEETTNKETTIDNYQKLSADEKNLLDNYNQLNNEGKDKAQEYVSDLTTMDKYTENDLKSKLNA